MSIHREEHYRGQLAEAEARQRRLLANPSQGGRKDRRSPQQPVEPQGESLRQQAADEAAESEGTGPAATGEMPALSHRHATAERSAA